jgi:acyl-homoserine lactone acylase PvdQ
MEDNMKKTVAALALALPCAALAGGAYDGVYQYGLSPAYYSVHQAGGTLLVVSLGEIPMSGVQFSVGAGYVMTPNSINYWSYAIGPMTSGNSARITGLSVFGACNVTTDVSIDGTGNAYGTFVNAVNTPFGTQQGVNCAAIFQAAIAATGPTIALRKIF